MNQSASFVSRAGRLGVQLVVLLAALLAIPAAPSGADEGVELVTWSGGPTPPLTLKDLDGRAYDLAQERGKALVINFWATWCPPCRDELPSLERLREALRGRPIDVVTVNVAEGETRVKRFLADVALRLPVLLDRNAETQRAWKVRGLPATFILDGQGAIRFWYLGELDWSQPHIVRTVESIVPPIR